MGERALNPVEAQDQGTRAFPVGEHGEVRGPSGEGGRPKLEKTSGQELLDPVQGPLLGRIHEEGEGLLL
jgi:hypothetical protein